MVLDNAIVKGNLELSSSKPTIKAAVQGNKKPLLIETTELTVDALIKSKSLSVYNSDTGRPSFSVLNDKVSIGADSYDVPLDVYGNVTLHKTLSVYASNKTNTVLNVSVTGVDIGTSAANKAFNVYGDTKLYKSLSVSGNETVDGLLTLNSTKTTAYNTNGTLKAIHGPIDSTYSWGIGAGRAPVIGTYMDLYTEGTGNDPIFVTQYGKDSNGNRVQKRRLELIDGLGVTRIPGDLCIYGEGIELYSGAIQTPHIDFHYNNTKSDYTSRILEQGAGKLTFFSNIVLANSGSIVSYGTGDPPSGAIEGQIYFKII